jgi:hypothetical protein
MEPFRTKIISHFCISRYLAREQNGRGGNLPA